MFGFSVVNLHNGDITVEISKNVLGAHVIFVVSKTALSGNL